MAQKGFSGSWQSLFNQWNLFSFPGRPNQAVCNAFFSHTYQLKPKRILILGSTPEFRDAAFVFSKQYKTKVFCADISAKNYKAMNRHTHFFNPLEKFVHANWCELPFSPASLDTIWSDAAFSNLPEQSRSKCFDHLNDLLKKNGRLITREDVIPKGFDKKWSLESRISHYSKKISNGTSGLTEALNFLGEECLRISAVHQNGKSSSAFFHKTIQKIKKTAQNPIFLELAKLLEQTYIPNNAKYWLIFPEKKFEDEMKRHFNLYKKIKLKNQPQSAFLPVFVLGKRGETA